MLTTVLVSDGWLWFWLSDIGMHDCHDHWFNCTYVYWKMTTDMQNCRQVCINITKLHIKIMYVHKCKFSWYYYLHDYCLSQ